MKTPSLFLALVAMIFAQSASAATYKGKCAKKAEEAAVSKWADVPNPDPNLEYMTLSSEVTARRGDTYIVILGLSDGNENVMTKYQVTFQDAGSCSKPTVTSK